jgi:CRISPR/Cas system-associated exonuclease Cas4 (RecB family)
MDLVTSYYNQKAKGIKAFPCHTNRASSLGGACVRELTYERTAWEKAKLPDVDLQCIFDEGNIHEGEVLRTLQEAGIQVIEQQRALEWREHQITGHVDAVVVVDGKPYPVDVKTMSPHIWDSCFPRGKGVYPWAEVEDKFTQKPWMRKYLGQVIIYCLLKEVDEGLLLCKNKGTGALAQVNIPLDYGYAESLIRRADTINAHVAAGTLPDRIPWEEDICGNCKYLHVCLPDRVGKDPLVFLEDSTVSALLEERAAVEEHGKEFKRLDERAKEWAKARPESKISIGNWLVEKGGSPSRVTVKFSRTV